MSSFRRLAKILAINLLLVCLGILIIEMGYRASKYLASCANQEYDARFFRLEPLTGNQNIGLTVFDPVLGFVPRPKFNAVIDQPSWNKARVTVTADGYRSNDDSTVSAPVNALAVGDSFTFGNQVSNRDTWPSCMQRDGTIRIANAGVPGYGAAQSVLRAKIELRKHDHINLLVWSILVDEDFARDRLMVHSGFIKPAVIIEQGAARYSAPPANDKARYPQYYEPERHASLAPLFQLASHLYLADALSGYLGLNERVDLVHPQAASLEQIIDFAFDEFNRLPAERKLVMLQYSKRGAHSPPSKEHGLLGHAAEARGLALLDTRNAVSNMEAGKIWDGHHTPLGNQAVCRAILATLQKP